MGPAATGWNLNWIAEKGVKRLTFLIILAILLAGLILFGLTDLNISVADTNIPDNEVAAVSIKSGEG